MNIHEFIIVLFHSFFHTTAKKRDVIPDFQNLTIVEVYNFCASVLFSTLILPYTKNFFIAWLVHADSTKDKKIFEGKTANCKKKLNFEVVWNVAEKISVSN